VNIKTRQFRIAKYATKSEEYVMWMFVTRAFTMPTAAALRYLERFYRNRIEALGSREHGEECPDFAGPLGD
jgi:hypothetical protein